MVIIASISWIVVTVVAAFRQQANARIRAEIYNRLIDKFGTAAEFVAFMESDAGLNFIEENTVQPAAPLGKILASTQIGIVLTLLGRGLLITGNARAIARRRFIHCADGRRNGRLDGRSRASYFRRNLLSPVQGLGNGSK